MLPKLNISRSANILKLRERETGGETENYLKLPKESKIKILHTNTTLTSKKVSGNLYIW